MSKVAIVTGASGNLGKAVVAALLEDGFQVIGTVLSGEKCGANEEHHSFEMYEADVSQPKVCEQLTSYVSDKYGAIDFAALLVGGFSMGSFDDTSLSDVQNMFKLNFNTAYSSSQAVYKQMIKQKTGGKIILIGAKPALETNASSGLTAYSLSKSIIFKLADHINIEGKALNTRAMVVVPSTLDTPPNRESMPDADYSDWVKTEDIANLLVYLASDKASALRQAIFRVYAES